MSALGRVSHSITVYISLSIYLNMISIIRSDWTFVGHGMQSPTDDR
jgi:hypothetical protein